MHRKSTTRKRWLPAVLVALAMFAVVGYAASLTLNTKTLAAGSSAVSACNASASVSYNSTYSSGLPGYKVTTAPITSAVACASMAYRLNLSGAGNASLAEVNGTLDASGNASPDFSSSNIAASLVTGVQLVITG